MIVSANYWPLSFSAWRRSKREINREFPPPFGNLSGNLWQEGKVALQQSLAITTESEALPAAADLLHAPVPENGSLRSF